MAGGELGTVLGRECSKGRALAVVKGGLQSGVEFLRAQVVSLV